MLFVLPINEVTFGGDGPQAVAAVLVLRAERHFGRDARMVDRVEAQAEIAAARYLRGARFDEVELQRAVGPCGGNDKLFIGRDGAGNVCDFEARRAAGQQLDVMIADRKWT